MNKFKNLVEKLVKVPLWRSKINLIQLAQRKNENGNVVYISEFSKQVNCVKKTLNKLNEESFFKYDTEFIVAMNELKEFDLNDGHFSIIYNSKKYDVKDIMFEGSLNNEDCLVSFFTNR